MGDPMKRLCTICARGGSKGVVNKNIRKINGKPVLVYSIIRAQDSRLFDHIAVSSDSEEILGIAKDWGADVLVRRPEELATDTAPKVPAIRHCAGEAERKLGITFETIVDLDASSPLRSGEDIRGAVTLLESRKAGNVITAAPARRSPYFNLVEVDERGVVRLSKKPDFPVVRRQDAPACFDMNASIYVWRRDVLMNKNSIFNEDTLLYVMPEERSLDIDSELDFEIVQMLLARREAVR